MRETRPPREKMIGECRYRVRYLPPTKALTMWTQLCKTVAPALGHLADGVVKGKRQLSDLLDADVSGLSLGAAVEALVARLDEGQVQAMVKELSTVTDVEIGGKWPALEQQFEFHFLGRFKELLGWFAFAMEVQFGDFFDGFGSVVRQGLSLLNTGPASVSPGTSAGPSGGSSSPA